MMSDATPSRSHSQEILGALVDFHYRSLPLALAVTLINLTLLTLILVQAAQPGSVVAWYLVSLILTAVRWWDHQRYCAQARTADPQRWRGHAIAGALVSGLIWGSASGLLFPADSLAHQAVLAFVLGGMAAGAVTTLSYLRPAVTLFLALALIPLALNLVLLGTQLGWIMGGMVILFHASLNLTARRMHQAIREFLRMRLANVAAARQAQHQAHYDELTRLPNRRLLHERLNQELARSRRHGDLGALLFLDLDHFKNINDSLGHPAGDQLLQQVARRLRDSLRDEDVAARLGGDEFVVMLSDLAPGTDRAAAEADAMAAQLRQRLTGMPYQVQGHELHVSASIGITLFPLGEEDSDDLLRQADTAMYSAKAEGRGTIHFYATAMQEAVDRRLQSERELRLALARDELTLFYQPMVGPCGRPYAVEALLRWEHPERGLVGPDQFIPVAEDSGIIFELGDWVFDRACRDLARLVRHYGAAAPNVSINLSPRQFRLPDLAERIPAIASRHGVELTHLQLEVTESCLLENVSLAVEKMHRLRARGVRFSIDDFGTGYSSLAYLKKLPVDTLKIDRSFIQQVLDDSNDAVIVETILAMAGHLGLKTVAEGVETRMVLEFLQARGCERFQGYLFARPLPFAGLLDFMDGYSAPGRTGAALISAGPATPATQPL